MCFQRWIAGRPLPINPFSPLSNASGKAAYWVIAGLFVVIVFSAAIFWYSGSGIEEKQSPSGVALSRDQISDITHRYKIERPAKSPVKPVAAEVPQDTAASGAPEGPSGVSPEKETPPAQTPERAAVTQQPISPPKAIEQPSESLVKEEPILAKESLDLKKGGTREAKSADVVSVAAAPEKADSTSPEGPISAREDSDRKKGETREAKSDDIVPGAGVPEKADSTSPPAEGGIGKRFFVQVDVGNVRDEPSMHSKVKFQVQKGCSVTVTDKRDDWYAIQMDDGRFGWVYQTLIADSLVPQKDIQSGVREITAIEVEPPVEDVVKLRFQLSAPHVPETVIIDEGNPRVVCDFVGTRIAPDIGSRIDVNNGMIEKIRIGLHQRPQSKVRVVLDLVPGRQYEIKDVSKERAGAFVLQITAKRPR